jgi:hypothetical protein
MLTAEWSRSSTSENNDSDAEEKQTDDNYADPPAAHSPTHPPSPSLTHHYFSPSKENSYTLRLSCKGSEITQILEPRFEPLRWNGRFWRFPVVRLTPNWVPRSGGK